MTKMTLKSISPYECQLSYDDNMGERVTRIFYICHTPNDETTRVLESDQGVGPMLGRLGYTLYATPDTLLDVIRREWRRRQRYDRAQEAALSLYR